MSLYLIQFNPSRKPDQETIRRIHINTGQQITRTGGGIGHRQQPVSGGMAGGAEKEEHFFPLTRFRVICTQDKRVVAFGVNTWIFCTIIDHKGYFL